MALIDTINTRPGILNEIIQHRNSWEVPQDPPNFLENYLCFDDYGYDSTVSGIRYTVVMYNANHMTFKKVPDGNDMVSFGFTGCYMVTLLRKDTGERYVGHIPLAKSKLEWELFKVRYENRLICDIKIFNPMHHLGYTSYPPATPRPCTQIWGLIMRDGRQNALEVYENWEKTLRGGKLYPTCKGKSVFRRII